MGSVAECAARGTGRTVAGARLREGQADPSFVCFPSRHLPLGLYQPRESLLQVTRGLLRQRLHRQRGILVVKEVLHRSRRPLGTRGSRDAFFDSTSGAVGRARLLKETSA